MEAAMQTGILGQGGVSRALLFALTGILWLVSWVVPPSFEMMASMAKWLVVLLFSAALLSLAVALHVFGRMVGRPSVVRLATFAGAVASLMSVANVFEDGLQIEWVFFVFVLGLLILDVALLALTIVIVRTAPDRYRLLAVIPAGTVAGILLFVVAGGPIMLVTWLAAAVAAVKIREWRTPVPAAITTP
jgi:hypothetical protein